MVVHVAILVACLCCGVMDAQIESSSYEMIALASKALFSVSPAGLASFVWLKVPSVQGSGRRDAEKARNTYCLPLVKGRLLRVQHQHQHHHQQLHIVSSRPSSHAFHFLLVFILSAAFQLTSTSDLTLLRPSTNRLPVATIHHGRVIELCQSYYRADT